MKTVFQTIFSRTTSIILLIAAVVLLCPAKPVTATELSVCDTKTEMTPHNGHGTKSMDCSTAHSELGSHTLNTLSSSFNNFLSLFLVAVAGFVLFPKESLLSIFANHLTRLRYCQRRYINYIKPKLEKIFLRWLTLLGGTIAFSS